jgi:ribosomal protein S18 acetylase RimI-like enzyme
MRRSGRASRAGVRKDHRARSSRSQARQAAGASASKARQVTLRPARLEDLPALLRLEQAAFRGDRLSPRSWRSLVARPSAIVMVALCREGSLLGATVLLLRAGSAVARLYSIAVDAAARGRGVGRRLLERCIDDAHDRGCSVLRLETRADNRAAQALFRRLGFSELDRKPGYYEDGQSAWRFQKSLWNEGSATQLVALDAPYYAQTLDFTCGPCALMMAMAALKPALRLDRSAEIHIWREATTVFMTAGHGGCGPYGLALAAARRGFDVQVHAPSGPRLFVDSVRDPDKKAVIELVEADSRAQLARLPGAQLDASQATPERIARHLRSGAVPIVLVSLWRLQGERSPHWVTVAGFDGTVFRLLDPVAAAPGDDPGVAVSVDEFRRITRYGRRRHTAAVVLSRKAS